MTPCGISTNLKTEFSCDQKRCATEKCTIVTPKKSLHIVNKIAESFKNGEKNVAEFWINLNNRFAYIRFFTMRDANGKYLGRMEMVQDLQRSKSLKVKGVS